MYKPVKLSPVATKDLSAMPNQRKKGKKQVHAYLEVSDFEAVKALIASGKVKDMTDFIKQALDHAYKTRGAK